MPNLTHARSPLGGAQPFRMLGLGLSCCVAAASPSPALAQAVMMGQACTATMMAPVMGQACAASAVAAPVMGPVMGQASMAVMVAVMGQASTASTHGGQTSGQARDRDDRQGDAATKADRRTNSTAGPLRPELRSLEQGTEDRGGFDASFRMQPLDLRVPTGFTEVYMVPGDEDERMMRGSGALFAVFPQSAYRRTIRGTVPIAPADTVFHIGMPGGFTFPGGSLHHRPSEIDPRVARRVDGRAPAAGGPGLMQQSSAGLLGGPRLPADAVEIQEADLNPMPAIAEAPRASRARGNRSMGQASQAPAGQASQARAGQAPLPPQLAAVQSAYDDLELGPAIVRRD